MLVLSRKKHQTIRLTDLRSGTQITILVADIKTNREKPAVRLAIDAPAYVQIWRTELLEDDQD